MQKIRETLSKYPVKTRVSLSGSLVVARDIAHAKLMVCISGHSDSWQFCEALLWTDYYDFPESIHSSLA